MLQPGHLPTPFTAAEIRDASPRGLTLRLRIETPGRPPAERMIRFVQVDAEGADRVGWAILADGSDGPATRTRSTWLEFQGHASFSAATTTREAVTLDAPMGRLECLRYVTTDGDATTELWFATAFPGMPIRTVETVGGQWVETMKMLSHEVT